MSTVESPLLTEPRLRQPTRPQPEAPTAPEPSGIDVFRRVRTKDLCRVARQLSTLLHAGLPLVPALSALAEQFQRPPKGHGVRWGDSMEPLALILRRVRDDVNEGGSLAKALSRHPRIFSSLFVNMVSAGETSGTLEAVLARLADILEKRVRLVGKVKAAVAYPAMMATVAAGVVVFLISFVVPGITRLFTEMQQELPWPTRLLIALSSFTRTYSVLLIILFCAGIVGLAALYKTKDGKAWADRVKLRVPLFGPLLFKLEVTRLTRTLGTLMKSGIPILTAIEITQHVIQNGVVAQAVSTIRERVHKGESIADAFRATRIFPPMVFHVIATGQMTGNIEDGLIDIAEMYDTEVESAVATLTSLMEPLILLMMGGVVGFIVLAILLPIFEINQAL